MYYADHFNWKSTIKAVLRQAPDQELPIKRLRKKVNVIIVISTSMALIALKGFFLSVLSAPINQINN